MGNENNEGKPHPNEGKISETPVELDLIVKGFHMPGIYTPDATDSKLKNLYQQTATRRASFARCQLRQSSFSRTSLGEIKQNVKNEPSSSPLRCLLTYKNWKKSVEGVSNYSEEDRDSIFKGKTWIKSYEDVVDIDDEAFNDFVHINLAGRLVESVWFRAFIFFIIVFNSVMIGVQTDQDIEKNNKIMFQVMDYVFLTIFIMEILIKWFYGFELFWKSGWNVFDFIIVLLAIIGPAVFSGGGGQFLRVLRVLRAFRTLRSVGALHGLQMIVQTIVRSVPDMANIIFLLGIIMFIFAVVGVTLFRQKVAQDWGSLPAAMFSLFICITQDGWAGLYERLDAEGQGILGACYLVLFLTVGAFVFVNLVVAVVVTNLEQANKDLMERSREFNRLLRSQINSEVCGIVGCPDRGGDIWCLQTPMEISDFSGCTQDVIQTYYLILIAIEDNLAEFVEISEKLQSIYQCVTELNQTTDEPESPKEEEEEEVYDDSIYKGDVLSQIMRMENQDLISSRRASSLAGLLTQKNRRSTTSRISLANRSSIFK
eukprot:Nk52_evm3s377 gene=Nk52_evmTU3s377